MLSIDEMKIYLKNNLIENRYIHTLGVVDTAIRLAKINKVDEKKAEIAALAHDIAKNRTIYELKENMSKLDKIIYMADMIEPNRNFPGVDILRRETFKDLDNGVLEGLNHTIKYLLNKGVPIDVNSIKARNYLLLHK